MEFFLKLLICLLLSPAMDEDRDTQNAHSDTLFVYIIYIILQVKDMKSASGVLLYY